MIEKTEKEYFSLNRVVRSNVRFLFDMITYGIYEGDYVIMKEWVGEEMDFGGFAKVEGNKILPNVEKLHAIFNEDWSKERIVGVMKKLSNNYKPFYLLSKNLDDRVRYLGVMSDDIRESLEVALSWAVNLARERDEIWEPFAILMYYRVTFFGFEDNAKLGIMDGEYILGKLDLETELKITNILGILNLYSENYTYAEYYLREITKRGEGVLRDMALLNLGVLEGRKGNIKAEYEIYKSLIEKSDDRRILFPAFSNILVIYSDSQNLGIKFDLDEILGLFNKGIRILREVKDRNTELKLRYNFAFLLTNVGNYGEAIRQVDEIVKISKETNKNEYADAMSLLGYVYLVMGDYQKSLQNFEEALRSFDLRDKNFEGRYYIAKVYYAKVLAKLGRVEEAKLIAEEIGERIGELKLIPQDKETIKQIIDEIKQYSNG